MQSEVEKNSQGFELKDLCRPMLGIVLWSDTVSDSAIIWCGDHQDLAYCGPSTQIVGVSETLETGTLCSTEIVSVGQIRMCKRVTVLARNAYPDLPEHLRVIAQELAA